ncbi:MAG TPA: FAD-dependent oxidoreductase, partial [Candidatus Hydrogenedentes bacterium]|nr:FAD-dependent oxidoreductase [Candidatus Hydrogenedentota bacterium]
HGDARHRVTEIECLRMELGEPDASGRRRPVEVPGSEFRIPADTVIIAIGNKPNPLIPQTMEGLETSKWGTIVVNPDTMETSVRGVFAAGDIVSGAATVISAMGQGRIAAASIHRFLSGEDSPTAS